MLANCELRIAIIWEMWWRETHRTDRTYMPLSFAITNLENLRWHKLNIHAALKKRKIRKLELIWWMVSLSLSCLPCIFFFFLQNLNETMTAILIDNSKANSKSSNQTNKPQSKWFFMLSVFLALQQKDTWNHTHTHTHNAIYW